MIGRSRTIIPRADRYGHPEKIDPTTSVWKSHKLDIAAPHCDKYGHVDRNDLKQGQPLTYDLGLFSARIS
jgi:hypothetical protein